jgi:hypothetical protein
MSPRLNLGTDFQHGRRLIGLRFRNVVNPQGATVPWTQLVFTPDDTNCETCRLTIQEGSDRKREPSPPSQLLCRDGKRPGGG